MIDAVCQNSTAFEQDANTQQTTAFDEPVAIANARISALGGHSVSLSRLSYSLKRAKSTQYKAESGLNEIAEDAFIAAGFLHADSGVDRSKVHLRLCSTTVRKEGPQPGKRGADSTTTSSVRSATHNYRAGGLPSRVRDARRRLKDCRRRLEDSRWAPISNAGSMNSTGQGEARFRRMKRRTQEVRAAELEYRSVLHRAQDVRAISESDQSSNIQDHESDGYTETTLKELGFPVVGKRRHRVHNWIGSVTRSDGAQQVQSGGQDSNASTEGSWVNRVQSMAFGEDPELTSVDRRKDRIVMWAEEQDRLRNAGPFEKAENDFHSRNRNAAADIV